MGGAVNFSANKTADAVGGFLSPPDFTDIALQQGEANEQSVLNALLANRPTQYTPFGAITYADELGPDGQRRWTQTTQLTPELQAILDRQQATTLDTADTAGWLASNLAGDIQAGRDFSGIAPWETAPDALLTESRAGQIGDPSTIQARAEDAVYQQAVSRLDPQFQQRDEALEIKLRNQGLQPGDEAWERQMGNLERERIDAYNQAQFGAIEAGRQHADQLFRQQLGRASTQFDQDLAANQGNWQQALQGATFQNQLREAQRAENERRGAQAINWLQALQSGQQVGLPQAPGFQSAQVAAPPDLYGARVDEENVGQARLQSLFNLSEAAGKAIASIGGAALVGGFGFVSNPNGKMPRRK